jgi:hypothetical protein
VIVAPGKLLVAAPGVLKGRDNGFLTSMLLNFFSSLTPRQNKLECLFLASFF